MQGIVGKIFIFLGIWVGSGCLSGTLAQTTVSANQLSRADSLFRQGKWTEATTIYELAMATGKPATDPMLLKLARAYEQQGDVAKLLYFLQVYFKRHPDETVLRKMNDIARANSLSGYETSDLNYFYLFYRQYGVYLLLILLLLGGYVFGVLLIKTIRRDYVSNRLKTLILLYLVVLLIFVNLPEGYESGITNTSPVLLRSEPSAAAPVALTLGRGHKVNILSSTDIWWRVYYNNSLYYVRKGTLWII
jgi:tetratricopeptide (TPR) repeat protein